MPSQTHTYTEEQYNLYSQEQDGLTALDGVYEVEVETTIEEKRADIAVDLDGVMHSYNGWKGAGVIDGPPVPGALEFIKAAQARGLKVAIMSSRGRYPEGPAAIRAWLDKHGFPPDMAIWDTKHPAKIYLDDRALPFDGEWPDLDYIQSFQPWYKREATPLPYSGYTSRQVVSLLGRTRQTLQGAGVLDRIARTYPFGPKNPLYSQRDVLRWRRILQRHDGLVALGYRGATDSLVEAEEIDVAGDTICPRCGGWARREQRIWCPKCGILEG